MLTREYPTHPIIGVGTVVWSGERVLLIRRGRPPRQGQWSLPGGAQQVGETVADAARREIFEEAGIEVELGQIIATIDLIERDDADRVRYHYTLIDFTAEASSDALTPGDDAADARWFVLDDLPALGLWSETIRIIERARTRRPCR